MGCDGGWTLDPGQGSSARLLYGKRVRGETLFRGRGPSSGQQAGWWRWQLSWGAEEGVGGVVADST